MKTKSLRLTRLLSLALALIMLIPVGLIGCANDPDDTPDNPDTPDTPNNPDTPDDPDNPDDETIVYTADVPDGLNLGGQEFRLLVYNSDNSVWYDVDFSAETITGEIINDAAFNRMSQVEQELGVEIVTYPSPDKGYSYMYTAVSTGDDLYDAGIVAARKAVTLAESGYLKDLFGDDIVLDTDAAWWDQGCTSGLSVANHLYMIAGDISILYRKSLRVYFFNKQIAEDNADIPDMYQLVADGNWTLETLATCVTAVSQDLDGDDEMTGEDMFGLCYSYTDTIGTGLVGAGVQFVTKDEDDMPQLSFYNDDTVAVYEAFADILFDFDHSICSGDSHKSSGLGSMFTSGRALFNNCELHNIPSFRASEVNFGILPTPKADEYQESYRHTLNPAVAGMIVIPITNSQNLDNTCYVLDSLGAASKNTLTPAYINTYLEGRAARDEESRQSLGIVFDTVSFDLGYIYNWGNIATFYHDLIREGSYSLTSRYNSIAASAQAALDATIANYEKNN